MTVAQRWVLALSSMTTFMIMLDALVVTTALQSIRLDLGATVEQLEWTVNAYTLSFAVLLMAGAALGDRFGRRRMLAIGIVIFVAASVACALAPTIGWLVAARVLQGVGAAAAAPVGQALLGVAFNAKERPKALGLFWSVTGLATLGGPIVGGVIVDGATWPWIFWLNVPIGLVLVPLVLTKIDESVGAKQRFDYGGVLLATVAAFGLVWALVRGNEVGWTNPEIIGAFVLAVLSAIGFVWWELRNSAPLVPIHFFKARGFSAGNSAIFLLFASSFAGLFFFAQLLQTVLHYGPLGAGLRLAPWTVTVLLFAPVTGMLMGRFGERPLVAGGLLFQSIAAGWFAVIADPAMSYGEMVLPFIIAGIGTSMTVPASTNAVFGAVPDAAFGPASGTSSTMRQLGGAFGIALAVAIFSAAGGGYATAQEFTDGFGAAMTVAALVALAGVAAGLAVPARRPMPVPEDVAVAKVSRIV
ncbi:DHA2 family efflux MFS transporter permease subunit [Nocardia sp. BMG51109]|uniref:DHA2 family efflux MFS transporter permease subunit n=1 Tax=Nocardia sp. BMG51109 TaxID=1056816 RepID=UPI000464E8E5|nr:DHA2 family efflux MFS transporter permease subunit [Nocardia sp. BMG51109]